MSTLTAREREALLALLTSSEAHFRAATAGLSDEDWQRSPAPGKWNPAQVTEHLALSEQVFPRLVRMALEEPAWVAPPEEAALKDREIVASMLDDTSRSTAVEAITPRQEYATGQEAAQAFLQRRARTIDYVRSTEDPLRAHRFPHPAYGPIDGYQWLLMLAHHADRHVRQIERAGRR